MNVSNLAHTPGRAWGFDRKQGRGRSGEPRCLINTARFCVLRARPRCGLPPSSRATPAPAWSCLNAGIRHAQNPALWCSADRSSGKTRGRRASVRNKGVGFDEDGSCGGEASSTRGTQRKGREFANWMIRYSLDKGARCLITGQGPDFRRRWLRVR
jgi:hypothetical protein